MVGERTPNGDSPTRDGSPIKKTDDVVGPCDQNQEIGNKLCILDGINKELSHFFNLRMDFLFK